MTTVRVLLDVDGVLNAVDLKEQGDIWSDWEVEEVHGFRITWSPTVIDFIRNLHLAGVEIQWLTTWGRLANEELCPVVDLPLFPVVGECLDYNERYWWKLPLVKALYEKDGVPFVWIDDDIKFEPEAKEWLTSLPDGQSLGVSPDTMDGLSPRQLEKITAFIDAHKEEDS